MNRYTIREHKYDTDTPMARLQELEDKIEDGVLVERHRGKWDYDADGNDWGIGAWVCSICKCKNDNLGCDNLFSPHIYAGSKYCPHCGADMRRRVR